MLRRLFDSAWFYFTAATILVVVAIASQFRLDIPSRPEGTVADIATLKDRDDLNVVFILVDTLDAEAFSRRAYRAGILVRTFPGQNALQNSVRITIGRPPDNDQLIRAICGGELAHG